MTKTELPPSSIAAFTEALWGDSGSLDAWLKANDESQVAAHIEAYANACATAEKDAEIKRLQAEMEVWRTSFEQAASGHAICSELVERLVEALEMCLETEERPGVIDFARAALAAAKQPPPAKEASWNTKPSKPRDWTSSTAGIFAE